MSAETTEEKKESKSIPNCREGCQLPHTLDVAMILLGVGRTRLYELMNHREIEYVDAGYGRRIRHDAITAFLARRTIR